MNHNLKKRLRNWKTWVALFGATGLTLKAFGFQGFEGTLGLIQDAVYMYGIALGVWTNHEEGAEE